MLIRMRIILKWDGPSNVGKNEWNIATLNEVEWITKKRFGRRNFTRIKTKQNRQNLQVSSFLMKSKKPLGCLISKLCASLLTYILIYISKDAHFHFWFWMPLLSKPIYCTHFTVHAWILPENFRLSSTKKNSGNVYYIGSPEK